MRCLWPLVVGAGLLGACADGPDPDRGDEAAGEGDGAGGDTVGGDARSLAHCAGSSPLIRLRDVQLLDPLLVDPGACRLYALDRYESTLTIVDIDRDELIATVPLDGQPADLELTPEGDELLVAATGGQRIDRFTAATGAVRGSFDTEQAPYRLAPVGRGLLYYVEERGYTSIQRVDLVAGLEEPVTGTLYLEPDLAALPNGQLYVGESGLAGGRLLRLRLDGTTLGQVDGYYFDGSFGLPPARRRVLLGPDAPPQRSLFYAQRRFDASQLQRLRGSYDGEVLAVSPDGALALTDSALVDVETFAELWRHGYGAVGAAFAADGSQLYLYDRWEHGIRRLDVATLLAGRQPGNRVLPGQPLSSYHLVQLLADPGRDVLYGLDAVLDQLVYIRRSDLTPLRAEIVGPMPVHMALAADGGRLFVATAGANEIAVVDLIDDSKVLASTLFTPTNPFKVAVTASGRLVYAEQDFWSDLVLFDVETGALLQRLSSAVLQPDLIFEPLGRYLYAGEGAVSGARLHRWELAGSSFELHLLSGGDGFERPARRVLQAQGHVYFAGCQFDAADITTPLACFGEDLWLVTPDDTLAFSASRIYRIATREVVGALGATSGVQTVTSDSETHYQFDNVTGQLYVTGTLSQYK